MTTEINLADAPAFIATLVREGIQFKSVQVSDMIVITYTGGY